MWNLFYRVILRPRNDPINGRADCEHAEEDGILIHIENPVDKHTEREQDRAIRKAQHQTGRTCSQKPPIIDGILGERPPSQAVTPVPRIPQKRAQRQDRCCRLGAISRPFAIRSAKLHNAPVPSE